MASILVLESSAALSSARDAGDFAGFLAKQDSAAGLKYAFRHYEFDMNCAVRIN
jgi:hypothetical protein